jgi:hypothetical protein
LVSILLFQFGGAFFRESSLNRRNTLYSERKIARGPTAIKNLQMDEGFLRAAD